MGLSNVMQEMLSLEKLRHELASLYIIAVFTNLPVDQLTFQMQQGTDI